MSDTATNETTTDLERVVGQLRPLVADLSFDELLRRFVPAVAPRVEIEQIDLPTVSPLTDEQKAALTLLPKVFGKVNTTERRKLEPAELGDLLDERVVIGDIGAFLDKRKEAIRTMVLNHIDTAHADDKKPVEHDSKGHVLIAEKVRVEGKAKCFSVELREGTPDVDADVLKEIAQDDAYPEFTNDDYLAMTTATRVVDEHKVMLALRKDPTLLRALAKATRPGKTTASLNLRNP